MSELTMNHLVYVEPSSFSDEALTEIVRAMALCGDNAIAKLAQKIRSERADRTEIESQATRHILAAADESRCWDLYLALMSEGAIDSDRRLDLGKLRGCLRR